MGDRIGQDSADGQPGNGGDAAEGADKEELLPEDDPDSVMELHRDPSRLQHVMQPFGALARSSAQLSKHDSARPGRLRDHPRRFDRRNDVGHRADPRIVSHRLSDALLVADPILQQRHNHRFRTYQRTDALRSDLGVVSLDAEEDKVGGTDIARVISGLYTYRERSGEL